MHGRPHLRRRQRLASGRSLTWLWRDYDPRGSGSPTAIDAPGLQVILGDQEMDDLRQAARRHRSTVGEWVRRALRAAQRREPALDAARKLRAIRKAAEHSFPTADIRQMIGEIERGYEG